MRTMRLPDVTIEILERGPFTPTEGSNTGRVRDRHGHTVANTDGHEAFAESIARLLNAAMDEMEV